MRRSLFVAISTGLLVAATAFAENATDVAEPFWKNAATRSTATEKSERLDHLRRAIEHLQAAGLTDLAIQIEEHAEREVLRSELALKRTELENVSKDIRRLERLLDSETELPKPDVQKQIMTRMKIIEVDTAKLEASGLKLGEDGLSGILFDETPESADAKNRLFTRRKSVDASVAKLLDRLRESQFAKVVAEPVLITTSGKPASFFSGGEVPVVTNEGNEYAINYRQVGTRIELLATVLPSGKIRLEVRPTLSRVVQAAASGELKSPNAGIESRTYDTAAELESGQTLALGGITTSDTKTGEPVGHPRAKLFQQQPAARQELILLITPEIVEMKTRRADEQSNTHETDSAPRALQLYPHALEANKENLGR